MPPANQDQQDSGKKAAAKATKQIKNSGKSDKPKKAKKKKKKKAEQELDGERITQAQKQMEKMKKVNVAVRFLQTEAQYLMRCGKPNSAVVTVNRILNHLGVYDLKHQAILGESMKEQTQVTSGHFDPLTLFVIDPTKPLDDVRKKVLPRDFFLIFEVSWYVQNRKLCSGFSFTDTV